MMIWFWDEDTFGLTEEKKNNTVRFFFFLFFLPVHLHPSNLSRPPWSCTRYVFCYLTVTPILPLDFFFFCSIFLYNIHRRLSLICSLSPLVLCVDSLSRYTRSFHFINIRNPNVYTQHELSSFPPLVLRHQ